MLNILELSEDIENKIITENNKYRVAIQTKISQ